MTTISLEKRETRKYVGTCQYLDRWSLVANADEIGSRPLPLSDEDQEDLCEPQSREVFILITAWAPDLAERWANLPPNEDPEIDQQKWATAELKQAIRDTYTQAGCSHEYDCCGCRSYYASEPELVTGDLWKVIVSSSRNF